MPALMVSYCYEAEQRMLSVQVFQESTLELRIAGPRVQQVRSQADALKMRHVD